MRPESCDVAIVGAGPAGLAAAWRLKSLGVRRVVVLDREAEPGGVPRHCAHSPYGFREFGRPMRGPAYARRLAAEAEEAGVEIRPRTTVVAIEPGPRLSLSTPEGAATLSASRVILATGARETSRAARLVGGARPLGVLTTGALQSLVHLKGLAPFRRPVIVGTELVSFSALLTCRAAGVRPVAMVESGPRPTARAPARGLPLLMGVPVHLEAEIERIEGRERVEGIVLRLADGAERRIACDGVLFTGRFTPEATLPRMGGLEIDPASGGPAVDQLGRASDRAVYVAGNLLRPVETAGWSWAEGRAVAERVALDLAGGVPNGREARLRVEQEAIRFALPQRLAPAAGPGMDHAQLRLSRPFAGLLRAEAGGRAVWSGRVNALPERRVLLPLAPLLAAAAEGANEIVLRGAP